jgi:hypothetical protein
MILSRPRTSDAVLVFVGLVIFILLILGVFLVVRKQPEIPKQSPGAPGVAALRVSAGVRFRTLESRVRTKPLYDIRQAI